MREGMGWGGVRKVDAYMWRVWTRCRYWIDAGILSPLMWDCLGLGIQTSCYCAVWIPSGWMGCWDL